MSIGPPDIPAYCHLILGRLVAETSYLPNPDVVKAVALGADAVYIGTAALLALGCHLCRACHAASAQSTGRG